MTRIVVTGAGGQLGRAVVAGAEARGHDVVGFDHAALDVGDPSRVESVLGALGDVEGDIDAVVHTAAWTDVDGCEGDPGRARRINGEAVGSVARAASGLGARLVHVSTDFVFSGDRDDGRGYAEDDPVAPISEYGRSKALGERLALEQGGLVVRTAWVFGPGGRNFPAAILKRARTVGDLSVVDDQTGSPTMTLDLAGALLDLCTAPDTAGIYHATNAGHCTWYDFAGAIVERAGLTGVPIARMSSTALDRPAPRPSWSVLDAGRLPSVRGTAMPAWQDALDRYLALENTPDTP